MRKKKTFDCVQMKWDIQKKIAEEFKGIPEKEARAIQDKRVANDPILGPFLKKVLEKRKAA
jgi:hypothetical protein